MLVPTNCWYKNHYNMDWNLFCYSMWVNSCQLYPLKARMKYKCGFYLDGASGSGSSGPAAIA